MIILFSINYIFEKLVLIIINIQANDLELN